ncbi:MAG: hypothetical protein JWP91_582 [Fibrobacteres bacterium]|nr:hypothetical protein [Fibrobacterota bacterium]
MWKKILLCVWILVGCKSEEKASSNFQEKPHPETTQEYTPSEKEVAVLKFLLADDFTGYAKGGDAMLQEDTTLEKPVRVTAGTLQTDYEGNEVLGDRKYRHKQLAVTGVVSSIDRGIGDSYFISLKGGSNMFTCPHASMADGYTDYLAALKKGQKTYLVCQGDGMLLGSAVLRDCKPAENWAEEWANKFVLTINKRLEEGNRTAVYLAMISVALASRSQNIESCLNMKEQEKNKCISKETKSLDSSSYANAVTKLHLDKSKVKDLFKN